MSGVRIPKNTVGLSSSLELAFRFIDWARHVEVTPQRVQDHFGVHRATAYRWVAAWKASKGLA